MSLSTHCKILSGQQPLKR